LPCVEGTEEFSLHKNVVVIFKFYVKDKMVIEKNIIGK
jgi:hypothetical protein